MVINIIKSFIFTIACFLMLIMGCVLGAYTGSFMVYMGLCGGALLLLGVQAMVEESNL